MSEERRQNDPLLIEISTRFDDFLDRYERDLKLTNEWRDETTMRLKVHCDFIKEVSPVYKRLCWVLGIAVIASVGIATTSLWSHVSWK